ncbi:MAG: hypothetical protein ABJB05_07065 [Parafilimonas sp.]
MSSFIFIIYLIFFSFFIPKIAFFKNSGLNKYWLIGLFFLKIFAGCIYGFFYSQPVYLPTSDTWKYFNLSKNETDWLLKDPAAFFKDLFYYHYNSSGNLFIAHQSYWNNLKDNVIIKILAVINVCTFKSYYADVIFFNFFFFTGCIAFYRLLKEKIAANKYVLAIFVFCVPSFLFWCSGLHKDGLVFTAIALCMFCFNEWIKASKLSVRNSVVFIFCALLLFALRNFVLLLLVPALFMWFLYYRYPHKKLLITINIYGLIIIAFFASGFINHNIDFPGYIINKQNEFKALGGNSQLKLPPLNATAISFIQFLPAAIDISFLRPHLTQTGNFLYLPAIAENIFIYLLIIYSGYKYFSNRKNFHFTQTAKIFIVCCFAFAISNLLMMGYTVTLTGAIVRYRSFVLPFIIAPLSVFINNKNNAENTAL